MLDLESAIIHAEQQVIRDEKEAKRKREYGGAFYDSEVKACLTCAEQQRQLAEWLRELQERRKQPEIIYCHECKHFQCNMRFDGSVPKGADAYECRHWCGGCDPMDYCSCGERAERRTDD